MTFSIRFVDQPSGIYGVVLGELVLDAAKESLTVAVEPVTNWKRSDYESQWRDGLKRIVDGKAKSCLITSLPYPGFADFLVRWLMYRVKDHVVFLECWLQADKLSRQFDPAKPYKIVPDKRTKAKVAEWRISFEDVVDFYERMATTPSDDRTDTAFERPEYFHPEEHPRAALEAEFNSGDADRVYAAFLNAAYYDDADWVQAKGIEALASPVAVVRSGALAALQILAAVRKELDPTVVVPAVMPLRRDADKDVRLLAKDVLSDIKAFFGQ